VSRSGLIKHRKKISSVKKNTLDKEVINCFKEHRGNYGRIRIRKALIREGIKISEAKIARILKENGLVSKVGRKKKNKKPKKTPTEYISENLVKDKFGITEINKLWCADITELKVSNGKMYISGIIDVGARKIVGWCIEKHARQEIVQQAIDMAYGRCNPKEGLIYHCDRGCQYTANKTKALLDKYKMTSSMSPPGTPNENQPIESFWKTLKQEIPDVSKLKFKKARLVIIKYIELYYNNQRLHSALRYQTPNEVWAKQIA
jgi:putative transposase